MPNALVARGRSVFASACAGCHTLTGHDTRSPGGDLAIAKLSDATILSFVRTMPVRISAADSRAVAAYVVRAAR
jgi:mono/diheme cytochrome c family protein